jgi:quinoprotein glucose dehydrogenase
MQGELGYVRQSGRARTFWLGLFALALALAILFWPSLASWPERQEVAPPAPLRAAVPDRATWSSSGGSPGGGQYSSLAQVTRENVAWLREAWTHNSGDFAPVDSPTGGTSFQATPIVANGMLYYCTPFNRVFALDPVTGAERWVIDLYAATGKERDIGTCRGVAYWEASAPTGAACEKRIVKGDMLGRVFAIDADTGKLCEDFGPGGFVDLNTFENFGRGTVSMTSPPSIYRDLVIVGSLVPDNLAADTVDGIVRALDVRTGREVWNFDPIPEPLRHVTGGSNVWILTALDVANGIVYLPTTSPSVDVYGGHRTADIPFANAVVALNAETGAVIWHYQIIHHDIFDYDLPAQPMLIDLERDGATVPAVVQITKTGFAYVFNRLTGEPLFPIDEKPVPQSDIEGEVSSPTQPIPRLPGPFARQSLTRDEVFGLTWFDRAACRRQFDAARYDGLFTPPSLKGSLIIPSMAGGGTWGAAAVDPARQVLIVRAQNVGTIMRLVPVPPGEEREEAGRFDFLNRPLFDTPYRMTGEVFLSPLGVPCTPPPWGELTALDLVTGETLWRVPLGQVKTKLFRSPPSWGSPGFGGPLVTASGIVFVGATFDSKFRAFDIDDGSLLWEINVPAPAIAVPMTFEAGGRQFVVVAAGGSAYGGDQLADALVAFALPPQKLEGS